MPFEKQLVGRAVKLNPALKVVGMDAGIAKLGAPAHDHGAPGHVCSADGGDPHIWLSPRLFCAMASNAVSALVQFLPQQRAALSEQLAATVAEIHATDRAVGDAVRRQSVKTWVVYHPSWSYFAADYGLSLLVIEEDGKTPAARHLAEIIGQARAAGVKVVFSEPQYDKRPAQTLAEMIDPLQEDWSAMMRDVAAKLGEQR